MPVSELVAGHAPSLKVLIADGAPLTRWAVARAFTAAGCEPSVVSDFGELLDRLMADSFDLLVSAGRFGEDDVVPMLLQIAHAKPRMRIVVLGRPELDDQRSVALPNVTFVDQPFAVAELVEMGRSAAG